MLKLVSWNVNGWRAIRRKGALAAVLDLGADIYAFQETKMSEPEMDLELAAEFEIEARAAEKKGYSGTMSLVRKKTMTDEKRKIVFLKNEELFAEEILQKEGRICAMEIGRKGSESGNEDGNASERSLTNSALLFLNVYFPNGGMSEERLQYKMDFYEAFGNKIKKLRAMKKWDGIIICGDVNTAHEEIDLARPKENSKNTGFLPMERAWVTEFLEAGFIDTFRAKHPEEEDAYSWWDYKTRARERNVGWRIDYFLVSENLAKLIKKAEIETEIMGSDHAPITLEIDY